MVGPRRLDASARRWRRCHCLGFRCASSRAGTDPSSVVGSYVRRKGGGGSADQERSGGASGFAGLQLWMPIEIEVHQVLCEVLEAQRGSGKDTLPKEGGRSASERARVH